MLRYVNTGSGVSLLLGNEKGQAIVRNSPYRTALLIPQKKENPDSSFWAQARAKYLSLQNR